MTTRRRSSNLNAKPTTLIVSHGVVAAVGIAFGLKTCGHITDLLIAGSEFLRTSAIYIALAVLVVWIGRALIVALYFGMITAVRQAQLNKRTTGAYHIFR